MKTILALALILMMGGVAMGEELFYTGDNYPGGINEDPCERLARSARKVADCMYPHDNAVISFRTPKNAKPTKPLKDGEFEVSYGGFNVNYFAELVEDFKEDLVKCEQSIETMRALQKMNKR